MINQRVAKLRSLMKEKNIDCYIIPSFDAHQSEYVANHWKSREWITGFTGSAGTAVITQNKALLWTDGRYHVQALKQLEGSEYELIKQGLQGVPTISKWITDNLTEGQCVGFDGNVMSMKSYDNFNKAFALKNLKISYEHDLISPIWHNRTDIPATQVFALELKYAGKSYTDKLKEIRQEMSKLVADAYLVPNLDDICWIFNIRADDVKYNPVVISYALITQNESHLFVNKNKVPESILTSLINDGVTIHRYEDILPFLNGLSVNKILYSPAYTSVSLIKALQNTVKTVAKGDIATRLKAVKNETEIKNLRNCHIKDGVAMFKFHKWLLENVHSGNLTELSVAQKVKELRAEQDLYIGESFNTIAGYGSNAAMMHYSATQQNFSYLKPNGFLLLDSGGQYYNGTTDITRTYALGELSDEQKFDYTITLKSHIGLAMAKFLRGACGPHLDILARKPMWDNGLDYKCGTGHGVGFLLGVHEGPHSIRCGQNNVALKLGMIITNEPGVYKDNRHGIRIENTVLVAEHQKTEFGEFYKLETISMTPIDTKPVLPELLSKEELSWLNNYHNQVYNNLAPYLSIPEKEYLAELTKEIK